MKHSLLFLFLILGALSLFSQKFVIEKHGENRLYPGVPQKLEVLPINFSASKLTYSMTNGNVIQTDSGIYIWAIEEGSAVLTIKSGRKIYRSISYEVHILPDAIVYLNGSKGGKISRKELLKADKLEAYALVKGVRIEFEIVEFIVSNWSGGVDSSQSCKGAYFTDQQQAIFKQARKGGIIIIEEVRALAPDGTKRKLNDLVFTLID